MTADQWKTIVINLQGKLTSKGEIITVGQKQQRKHALKLKKMKPKTKGKQYQQQHTIKSIKSAQNCSSRRKIQDKNSHQVTLQTSEPLITPPKQAPNV